VGSLLDEVYDAVHVEGDDGFLAFVGFQLGPGLELLLPLVVGVHVGEDQNPELLSKKQDTLNVKKSGGRRWQAIPCVILFVAHDSCHRI